MSLKQKKDAIILFSLIIIPVFLIAAFSQYFITHDPIFLYIGIATLLLVIIVTLVRHRDIIDYTRSLYEKWK